MGKRKADEELSSNRNTIKERRRRERASEEQRQYEKRRHADITQETRAIEKLQASLSYQNAGPDRRRALIDSCKENVKQLL
jgi:hypothetical protein